MPERHFYACSFIKCILSCWNDLNLIVISLNGQNVWLLYVFTMYVSGNGRRPNVMTKTDLNNKIVPNNNGKRNGQKIISGPQGAKWVGRPSFKMSERFYFIFLWVGGPFNQHIAFRL